MVEYIYLKNISDYSFNICKTLSHEKNTVDQKGHSTLIFLNLHFDKLNDIYFQNLYFGKLNIFFQNLNCFTYFHGFFKLAFLQLYNII